MIRSDYGPGAPFPGPFGSRPRMHLPAAPASRPAAGAASAEHRRGPSRGAPRRRARLREEQAHPGGRPRGRPAMVTIVLYGACDSVVARPTGRSSTLSTQLVRAGGVTSSVLDALAAATAESYVSSRTSRLVPPSRRRRPPMRTPSVFDSTPRSPSSCRCLARGARPARAGGPALGRRVDAAPRPTPRPCGRRGTHADRRDVS